MFVSLAAHCPTLLRRAPHFMSAMDPPRPATPLSPSENAHSNYGAVLDTRPASARERFSGRVLRFGRRLMNTATVGTPPRLPDLISRVTHVIGLLDPEVCRPSYGGDSSSSLPTESPNERRAALSGRAVCDCNSRGCNDGAVLSHGCQRRAHR